MKGVRKYSHPIYAFSVYGYNVPYGPIWIQFGEVHLDPCAFDYTKFENDWVKLTPPFGVKLNLDDFEPLAAMLFCQSTSSYLSRYSFGPTQS